MGETIKNKDAEPEESRTTDLDEGLQGTFPGSDPLSSNQPGGGGDTEAPRSSEAAEKKK